jgi:hypothetical protein
VRTALVIALAGCATAPTARPIGPLGGTVDLTEIASDGQRFDIQIASDGQRSDIQGSGVADVDINSRIELRVHPNQVGDAIVRRADDETAGDAIARVKSQLVALTALTAQQRQVLTQLATLTRDWIADSRPHDPSDKLKAAVARLSAERVELDVAIGSYARAAGQAPSYYFEGPPGETIVRLDTERRRLLAEARKLASGTPLRWRMQAVFARGEAIHLDNYDTIPDAPFALVDKLAPQISNQQLVAQFEEAKQLTKDLKELSTASGGLMGAARTALEGFFAPVRQALGDDLGRLDGIVADLRVQVKAIPEVQAVETQLESLVGTFNALRADCAPVLAAIQARSVVNLDPLAILVCGRSVRAHLPDLRAQLGTAAAAVVALQSEVKAHPDKFAAVSDALNKLEIVALVNAWVHDPRWEQLGALLDLASKSTSAVDWRVELQTDRALRDITDSTIDLRRTDRKEGDLFFFRPSITNQQDGSLVVAGATTDFRVVRMGTYLDLSAGVSFVDKQDHHWGPFDPAPEILAALHYRWRADSVGLRMLNALRPGIGIHFLYPDLGTKQVDATGMVIDKDPSFELGVGGTLTLFGDLLQIGVGYDLQAQVSYSYIGFGLDTLAKLGVRFSPGD